MVVANNSKDGKVDGLTIIHGNNEYTFTTSGGCPLRARTHIHRNGEIVMTIGFGAAVYSNKRKYICFSNTIANDFIINDYL